MALSGNFLCMSTVWYSCRFNCKTRDLHITSRTISFSTPPVLSNHIASPLGQTALDTPIVGYFLVLFAR